MKKTSSAVDLLVHIDRTGSVPMRLQLERELRRAIQSGRLRHGAPLPSTRALATDLGLSRGVVVEAYEQLLAEGYLSAHRGSATRVAGRRTADDLAPAKEDAAPTPRYDFRPGLPDLSLFPRRAWVAAMRRAFSEMSDAALDYPDPRGAGPARRAITTYLNRARATVARADRVVFCSGSAQGIGLLCRVLRERGVRRIAVEDRPCSRRRSVDPSGSTAPAPIAPGRAPRSLGWSWVMVDFQSCIPECRQAPDGGAGRMR
jgi:GntR family transcriptional regulator / MocR family aminotransferase